MVSVINLDSTNICLSSSLASFILSNITTPFPTAKPSALSTYGGDKVSKKAYPSSTESVSKLAYEAVGIL